MITKGLGTGNLLTKGLGIKTFIQVWKDKISLTLALVRELIFTLER